MAVEKPLDGLNLIAAADLSARQFHAAKVSGNFGCDLAGAGEKVIGILQNAPTSGRVAEIMTQGMSKMVAGSGGVTAGDDVASDSGGEGVVAATDDFVIGTALETAVKGQVFSIYITHSYLA